MMVQTHRPCAGKNEAPLNRAKAAPKKAVLNAAGFISIAHSGRGNNGAGMGRARFFFYYTRLPQNRKDVFAPCRHKSPARRESLPRRLTFPRAAHIIQEKYPAESDEADTTCPRKTAERAAAATRGKARPRAASGLALSAARHHRRARGDGAVCPATPAGNGPLQPPKSDAPCPGKTRRAARNSGGTMGIFCPSRRPLRDGLFYL